MIEANAVPVFADIELDTFNLDSKAVEAAITPRTRAIMPVHFAGQPAEMVPILALAKKRKLVVIEDAAHAHGARPPEPSGGLARGSGFLFVSIEQKSDG